MFYFYYLASKFKQNKRGVNFENKNISNNICFIIFIFYTINNITNDSFIFLNKTECSNKIKIGLGDY